ncbi:MAG TPA: low molecular weight phosphotyrosine protein phosphatase [Candidatus Bariatricus faecipullorum]|nr:low molecular weight phosphotyrosine protein phosphatase [Candidatus Bariatricus faecipullorum]
MIKVLFVCTGNICRSTMAEYVFKDMVKKAGREQEFHIDSAGTSREEEGNGVHYGTREKLRQQGIPCGNHRARQMTRKDYEKFDYLIGMDDGNIRGMRRIAGGDPDGKIYKLLEFSGSGRNIADPWYTGNFDATWADVTEGLEGLKQKLL